MTLLKCICVLYQFHHQIFPIMKVDRGKMKFREYVSTTLYNERPCYIRIKSPEICSFLTNDCRRKVTTLDFISFNSVAPLYKVLLSIFTRIGMLSVRYTYFVFEKAL